MIINNLQFNNISYKIPIEGESPFLSYSYRIGANSKFDNQ